MVNKVRKMITILSAAAVVSTIAACANNTQSSDPAAAASATAPTDSQSPEEVKVDPFGKYDPPIEITFVGSISDQFEKTTLTDGVTLEDNVWTKAFLEELGIKVKYKWIAKSPEEYKQKLNLSLASGDIPDVMTLDTAELQSAIKADIIQDVGGIIEQYGIDEVKQNYTTYNFDPYVAAKKDGKIFAVPQMWSVSDNASGILWIRQDWLEKVGMTAPKTMDDVYAISKAFTHNDPDGNNKNDTFGLAISKDYIQDLGGMFYGYNAYPGSWMEKDGQLVNGSILPETKGVIENLAAMYKDGQIDPEFYVKPADKIAQDIASQKHGMMYGFMWNGIYPLQDSRRDHPEADWRPYLIPAADGSVAKPRADSGIAGYYVVNKNFKHPEALVKMMNLLKTLGPKDPNKYSNSEDGKELWKLSPVSVPTLEENLHYHKRMNELVKSGETPANAVEQSVFDKVKQWTDKKDETVWGFYRMLGNGGVGEIAQAAIEYYFDNDLWVYNAYRGAPTQTMSDKGSTLSTLESEAFVKMITGQKDIGEFDKFVTEWKKLGGDDITREVNDWYANAK
ncbi:extracellular solute-binding protein [Paenibacillus agaridevorans]|uniref:extracellular solute-binding protein n=1 Tax=Paenibacillus agaridevorans TaxID=171404 RepID=UPI001BE4D580|nr:extracellular solute-binding protein [Paenibacillus agaridevorans]